MTIWPKSAEEIADELRGTCASLHEVLERHDMRDAANNTEFCHQLDAQVFECTGCSWWCEHSEMSEGQDWVCSECEDV